MRPALLEIEGFTCYRDKQVIRFEHVEGPLAIAGPTGSGKSTVLDAMLFALYGRVPRVSNRVAKLVSQGMTRAAIRFEFDLGDARYRLVRTVYSNTNPSAAQLERVDTNQRLADGVRAVDDHVRQLLGLDLDAFVQSVILPQGRFAEFLTSEPRKRRELLMDLLGLSVYGRMHGIANEDARVARAAAESRRKSLTEDYREVTDEAVAALEAKVSGLSTRIAALTADVQARREALKLAEQREEASRRLARARQDLAELDAERPRLDAERQQVDASRRARRAQPSWMAAREAEARAGARAADYRKAEGRAEAARQHDATARAAHKAAQKTASEIPAWRRQLEDLGRIEGRLGRLQDLERELTEAARRLSEASAEHAQLVTKRDEVLARLGRLESEREEIEQQLAALGFDPERHQNLDAHAQTAREVVRVDRQLAEQAKALEGATAVRDDAAHAETTARAALDTAVAEHETSGLAAQAARDALRDAEQAHGAASLRAHLHAGDACPVCLQPVDPVPDVPGPPELAEARTAVDAAEAQARQTESHLGAARAAHQRADQVLQRALAQVAAAQEAVQRTRAERDAALGILEQDVAAWLPGGGSLADRLLAALAASERDRTQHEALRTRQGQATRDHDHARSRRDELLEQIARLDRRLLDHRAELAEREQQVAAAREGLEGWSVDRVGSERTRLEDAIRQAEEALAQAGTGVASAREALAGAEASLQAARASAEETEREAEAARATAQGAVATAGFANVTEAAAALVPEAEEKRIDELREAHERKRAAAQATVKELEPVVGDVPVTEAEMRASREALESVSAQLAAAQKAIGTAEAQLDVMRQRLERSRELRDELAIQEAKAEVYEALAAELRSHRFPEWVLETEFRELVRGASQRWFQFTDRYTLRYEANEFLVVDHDNAQETRTVDTLSGGETFLCSLALALELSEQIQRRAGALRFDCLFIDEGFGSLDPETLDTVAEAIERLGAGRRMVGLISHVAALTERMPSRLIVSKGAGCSAVTLSVAP